MFQLQVTSGCKQNQSCLNLLQKYFKNISEYSLYRRTPRSTKPKSIQRSPSVHVWWSLHCYKILEPGTYRYENIPTKILDFVCLTQHKKRLSQIKFERCAFSLVTRLFTLQNQSSLRLVKVSTGEFMCKNLSSIFLLGSLKWSSR